MAVVHVNSTQITNRQATPRVLDTAFHSRVRHQRGIVTITNGDDIDSTYTFFQVPSSAIPISLRLSCVDNGALADFGLYNPALAKLVANALPRDLFASAVSMDSVLAKSEILRESTTITVAKSNYRLWELITSPPTSNPNVMYDVVASLTGAADITGQVLLEMDYVVSTGESQT